MRKLRFFFPALPAILCLAAALAGCSAFHNASTAPPALSPAPPAFGALLPSPGELRAVSATEVSHLGSEYEDAWAHDNVARVSTAARFTPNFVKPERKFENLAYALYSFSVVGFTGDPVLHLYFNDEGAPDSGWIGLADYAKARWDWYALPALDQLHSQLPLSLAGRDAAGVMPVAVVFTETLPWELAQIKLGELAQPEPGDWPMAGHDVEHTHRATVAGSQTGVLKWRFQCEGPGLAFTGVAVAPNGTVYAGAGSSLLAYDSAGKALWCRAGLTPSTTPAIGADGTVYVGGSAPNPGLHAVSSTGTLLWTYTTPSDVFSNPAVGPDGTIYFGCDDANLYAVNPDGTLKWPHAAPSSVRGSPAVNSNGVYFGYQTGGMHPVGHLLALNANGSEQWDNNVGTLPRTKPGLGADGAVYCSNKDGVVYAYNADGSSRWSNGSVTASPYSAPLPAADNTVYIGSKDGKLYAIKPDGSADWSYTSDSEVLGGPLLAPDGSIIAASINGTLFAVDASGAELWTATPGGSVLIAPAVGDGMAYLSTDTCYLYAIDTSGAVKWQSGAGGTVLACPVTAVDGTLYVGSDDGFLYAVRSNGTVKWRYQTGRGISSSPAVGPDGTVYVGSKDNSLHAVNPDGTPAWQFAATGNIQSSPVVDELGEIYFGSDDTYVYAVNPDGTQDWAFKTKWNVSGSPAVDASGNVYAGSWDKYVYRIRPNGTEEWSYKTDGPVKGGVTLGSDGRIYAACEKDSESGVVYALRVSGAQDWSYTTVGPVRMSPMLGLDGTVYAASSPNSSGSGGALYAITDGSLRWEYAAPSGALGLAMDKDGVLYLGTLDGRVLALNDAGSQATEKWSHTFPGATLYTPAITSGHLYIGDGSGVYGFGD